MLITKETRKVGASAIPASSWYQNKERSHSGTTVWELSETLQMLQRSLEEADEGAREAMI
jgi:hypothetical protein